jgi:outer membrane protein OmpA-like peptidoglycan-associated protein
VKVGKDLSFSVKDLPPGDYSITFDAEDLDYIDAQPVIPEIKFSVRNKSDSTVKVVKPISLGLKKSDMGTKAKTQSKIIVRPNQIRKVKYSDPQKLMEKKGTKSIFSSYLKYLQTHRKAKLNIIVHTDDIGEMIELQKQSQETAQKIAQYFIGKGISRDRLLTRGMGPIDPIASNKTKAGRAKNKRIELKIIK